MIRPFLIRLAGALFAAGLAPAAALAQDAYATADLNLRAGPGTQYAIVGSVPEGAGVDTLTCAGSWCRIRYEGDVGWVAAAYLAADEAAAPPTYVPPPVYAPSPPVYVPPAYGAPVYRPRPRWERPDWRPPGGGWQTRPRPPTGGWEARPRPPAEGWQGRPRQPGGGWVDRPGRPGGWTPGPRQRPPAIGPRQPGNTATPEGAGRL